MKKKFKRFVASFLTVAMTLGSATISYADGTEYSKDDFFTADDTEVVYYTIAGDFNDGNPINKENEFEPTVWENVYSKKVVLTDSDENQFKIYRIDETSFSSGGETSVLCLGTNVFDEAQTHFKLTNMDEKNATVFFDAVTGAVVVLDIYNSDVDYSFSWVGDDQEEQYITMSEFSGTGYLWPNDKVKADYPEDMAEQHEALLKKVTGMDLGDESLYWNGECNYTVAGGSTGMPWQPASSANQMIDSGMEGILAYKMTFPAYDEDAEWLNRFKILRLDDITCSCGWLGTLCLGTTTYDDNQTTFRVENEQELKATIYLEPATGAVVIIDEDGNNVDYKFSWVGWDDEVQYTTVSEFATCGLTWPSDKVKTSLPDDLEGSVEELRTRILVEQGKIVANYQITETVENGQLIVRMNIPKNKAIAAGNFTLKYDREKLSLTSTESGSAATSTYKVTPRMIGITGVGMVASIEGEFTIEGGYQSGSGEIVRITFDMTNCPVSIEDITFPRLNLFDTESELIASADTIEPNIRFLCKHENTEERIVSEGDCETQEIVQTVCIYCGKELSTYNGGYLHDWSEWELTAEPTCTKDGELTRVCEKCGKTETSYESCLGHDYDYDHPEVVKKPTDTEDGSRIYTCKRCGEKTEEVILAGDFFEDDLEDGKVHYSLAGGITSWDPLKKDNEMTETKWAGVYSKKVTFPEFVYEEEWKNRFKILLIDDKAIHSSGGGSQLCLGTTAYGADQTTFRVENYWGEMEATVYFDSNTGAVIVIDEWGGSYPYYFSWVGDDTEVQYTTVSNFATTGYWWPYYRMVTEMPLDLAEKNEDLKNKIDGAYVDEETQCLLSEDGTVLLKYKGESEELVIPQSVKTIADSFFESCSGIRSVRVADGNQTFKVIDDALFSGETLVYYPSAREDKSYTVPVVTVAIGKYAFANCSWIETVSLPEGLELIEENAFLTCMGLKKVEFPTTLNRIGEKAFCSCGSLKEIKLPDGLAVIGTQAFWDCGNLRKLVIPASAERIGDNIFTPESTTLYCNRDSYAAAYAEDFDIRNVVYLEDIVVLKSEEGFSVEGVKPEITEETVLSVKALSEGDDSYDVFKAMLDKYNADDEKPEFLMYELGLEDTDGNPLMNYQNVNISIPVPEKYSADGCDIYQWNENGNLIKLYQQQVEAVIDERCYYQPIVYVIMRSGQTFKTDKLSESDVAGGKVYYTIAGGFTNWDPFLRDNVMENTEWENVFKKTFVLEPYDENAEWEHRFKLTKINERAVENDNAWWNALCLGTKVYNDNQTSFRIENEEALEVTIYFDAESGAVLMLDQDENVIDYNFAWVGWDGDLQYTKVSEFATSEYEWPAEYMKVSFRPNIAKRNEILYKKIMGTLTDEDLQELEESEKVDYSDKTAVTYHFYNEHGWERVGAWIKEGTGWDFDVLPLDRCVVKDTDDGTLPHEPIWPGALMEDEGGNWYKITCYYDNFSLGSMMIFNNYVGDSKPGDVTTEADIQKLRDAGVTLNDVKEKVQTPNIMIRKNTEPATDYYLNWDGDTKGSLIVFGKSDMFTTEAPQSYLDRNGQTVVYEEGWQQTDKGWWYQYADGSYAKSEWKQIEGKWYYFGSDGYMKKGWLSLANKWYYLNTDGTMVTSAWKQIDGKWYRFTADGSMKTGWYQQEDTWYYFHEDGTMAADEWVEEDTCYLDADGKWIKDKVKEEEPVYEEGWQQTEKGWWYQNADGTYPKNEWKQIEGKWYYFGADGYMKTGWLSLSNKWYYLNTDGSMLTNEWKKIDGKWYRFTADGSMKKGWYQQEDTWYYFHEDGTMAADEWVEEDTCYLDADGKWIKDKVKEEEPVYVEGWQQTDKGWWYQNADGTYPKSEWKQIEGKWYYFGADGYMKKGWLSLSNKWYYLNTDGSMLTNEWKKIDGKWYRFTADGSMKTGWFQQEDTWYYFHKDGTMAADEWVEEDTCYLDADGKWIKDKVKEEEPVYVEGWQKSDKGWWYQNADGTYPKSEWKQIEGKWYYFGADGYMKKGWLSLSNKWYYLNADGSLITNAWKQLDGKWYRFAADGAMKTGWYAEGGKYYYLNKDGSMAVDTWVENGQYYVDATGIWVQNAEKAGQ